MCAAKPLVMSNCVGNKDLVIDNYNGFLFDNTDKAVKALHEMVAKRDSLQFMGMRSLELVQKEFSIEQMTKEYSNLYKSCVSA